MTDKKANNITTKNDNEATNN